MTPRTQRTQRWLIAGGGLVLLVVLAGLAYARRVDPVEVTATLLYIPIFVAILLWRLPGGLAAAAGAAAVYAALRYPAMQIVGADWFLRLLAGRTAAYLAFGGIGGWAMGRVRASMDKLDLYDERDDATGLGNARSVVHSIDLELSRSERYETVFSVVVVNVPADAFEPLGRRARQRLLRDLGAGVGELVRTVDRTAHAADGRGHLVAVVLPETGAAGARVFAGRFQDWVVGFLAERGAAVDAARVGLAVHTHPGDDTELAALRDAFTALVDAPEPTATPA